MPSETDIANIAMQLIGEQPITSLDEDSDRARLAKAYFRGAVDRVLAAHSWTWAKKRSLLSDATETPAFGYSYQYLLPADCLRVWSIEKEGISLGVTQKWEREGDYLLTDVSAPLQVVFSCRRSSYARLDQYLADVMGASLALAVAQSTEGSNTGVERMQVTYERFLAIGKTADQLWQNQSSEPEKSGFETAMGF
ncbi:MULTISPECIES: hypothetical protein [Thalassospira]|uniref:Uncharacterized protein n=1 Tax=Thalassospira aquimaris TaxID=3037796 RepID=A0ABT6GHP2_9PROT|nr:hypothetical protein [Thalassospira sp. FZY0004]MDG4721588.1 hypothetical protein [Thalassospira sp. FZY0004]